MLPLEGPEEHDQVRRDRGRARLGRRGRCRSRAWPSSGIGFKTVGEAIYLRNHVLSRLDYAASVTDASTGAGR